MGKGQRTHSGHPTARRAASSRFKVVLRRLLRFTFLLAVAAGVVLTFVRRTRRPGSEGAAATGGIAVWPALDARPSWVEPVERACPDGYPVKAKLSSGIYHLPGMLNYERTIPDRCYESAAAATADGLRPAKR